MSISRRIAAVLAVVAAALILMATPSAAVDSPGYTAPPPEEPVTTTVPKAVSRTSARAATPVARQRQSLPITGSDMAALAVIGVVLVGGGTVLVALRRRSAAI